MQISSVEKVVSVMKTAGTFGPMTAETEAGEKEEIQALLVSQDYYDVFPSITLQGSFRPLAENMNSIMISEDFAARMFGDKDPVGESIVISEGARGSYSSISKNYQICGVRRCEAGKGCGQEQRLRRLPSRILHRRRTGGPSFAHVIPEVPPDILYGP